MSVREHDPAIDLEHVIVDDREPHARITLNRPREAQCAEPALMGELVTTLRRLGDDPEVRTIVVEGAGPAFARATT